MALLSPLRLLAIAEAMCGPEARRLVFEPLVADWEREWRECSSPRRILVLLSGGVAFCRSLLCCFEITSLIATRRAAAFGIIVAAFGVAGTALVLQPLNYQWVGFGIELRWLGLPSNIIYLLPGAVAAVASIALLPALMLAAVGGWSIRRLVLATVLTLMTVVIVHGWIAPAGRLVRARGAAAMFEQDSRIANIRAYGTTSDAIVALQSDDSRLTKEAWGQLRELGALLRKALSFAFLGIAVGLWRRRVGLAGAGGAWAAAWVAYDALQHWAVYLLILASLPRTLTQWVAPGVFVAVSVALLAIARCQTGTCVARTQ